MRKIYQIFFMLLFVSFIGQMRAQQTVNIGETPWKFSKVIRQESNLVSGLTVLSGTDVVSGINDGKFDTGAGKPLVGKNYFVDLLEKKPIERIKLVFNGDSVRYVACRVEVSDDNNNWRILSDGLSVQECELHKENIFTEAINNTIGNVAVVTRTLFSVPVPGSYRYVRFTVTKCLSSDQKDLSAEIGELLVHPVSRNIWSENELTGIAFDDSGWETVGLPHCFNERDTYLNATTGERCWRGEAWYRKKMFISEKDRNKKIFLEFQSVNIGAIVYINGHAIQGIFKAKQPGPVTHVGSFMPFVVDITDYIKWNEENQVAVRVSNSKGTFFAWPGFGENEGFGQAMGGIAASVYLHKKHKVHIPYNSYTPLRKWGTYFGTVSANPQKAVMRFQTNVENATDEEQSVELRTKLIDKKGRTVLSFSDVEEIAPGQTRLFDRTGSVENPHLWYPVGCSGEPYLYTVSNQVYVNGKLTDTKNERCGIREITWDEDYCYVNGEKCILRGFGNRNIYPGLGSAVPVSLQWQDIAYIAKCGGNAYRVGHQPPFAEIFEACDAYGVLVILNTGDNEWALRDEPSLSYKWECDRDVMIAYRSHPSVAVWESNNGLPYEGEKYYPSYTLEQVRRWDYIQPRIVSNRDGFPPKWNKEDPVLIGYTNRYEKMKGYPSYNSEVYGTNWSGNPSWCIARFDYDNEKRFSQYYVENYLQDVDNKACGWIDWMLAETYGEGYTIYLNGKRNQKSLGSCAMDGNRFPKLKYRIYQNALWVPYSQKPGVALQSHWNYSGIQDVDAWSNCPYVELFINDKSYGIVEPDSRTRRCTWKDIQWVPGVVEAVGLDADKKPVCSEKIESSGEPYAIEVTIEKPMPKPDGEQFVLRANASDAFIVTAKIVDKEGRWCPRADNLLKFEVEGEGVYKGSYNFYVTEGKELSYHTPGDTELQAEGGLMRVAVRTTFNPGKIKVKVKSEGLVTGEASVRSKKVKM